MEDKGQAARQSGIPRLSRLPVPNTLKAPTLRPAPSRENLAAPGELRSSKLRTAPSRELLSSTGSLRRKASPIAANSTLRGRVASTYHTPTASHAASTPIRRVDDAPKRSLTLSRRPSQQQFATPTAVTAFPGVEEPSNDTESHLARDDGDRALAYNTIRYTGPKPRPSLSERTIETLSQLPSSPAGGGKTSAFFDPDRPSRRSSSRPGSRGSRPGSSYQSDGSNRSGSHPQSRPGSSAGPEDALSSLRSSTTAFKLPLAPIDGTPTRGRMETVRTPGGSTTRTIPGTPDSVRSESLRNAPQSVSTGLGRTPSPEKASYGATPTVRRFGAKTMAARPTKSRPSLNGIFKKPSAPNLERQPAPSGRKASLTSHRSSTSNEETNPSGASTTSTVLTVESAETPAPSSARKSSAALREQIAKAKAAKRAATRLVSAVGAAPLEDQAAFVPADGTFDFGLSQQDAFGQVRDCQAGDKIIQARVQAARTSGRLNIAALGLREIPVAVINMYDLESIGRNDGSWAESVDLTRFVAADNEIEMIEDAIFPDQEPHELADDEDSRGNIFGGLETLDLHGNMLISLPMGLRRLQLLTSLNLSSNRITNNALEVISQITSLRDLKLSGNLFYGPLDPCFTKLENLEIADLHGNSISALPLNLDNMSKLRILNISENNFESLVFEPLSKLPLTELLVRKNRLRGVLIEDSVDALAALQVLDVSANQLTHLVGSGRTIALPALHQLVLSTNRLQELPDTTSWTGLVTLAVDENNVNSIPTGFTDLVQLRHADFSSNDIRVIPPEIGRMENLATLRLSGNPLRDKKFCTATTEDVKATLVGRLEPISPPEEAPRTDTVPACDAAQVIASNPPHEDNSDGRSDDDFATPPTSAPHSPARSRSQTLSNQVWPVKAGGILDRSGTESSSLHPVICSRIAAESTVREIYLQRNLFTALPDSLSFFADSLTALSLATNQMVGESYLVGATNEGLDLPSLKELNLASNHITGLEPLIRHLRAPALQKLDVSMNRISALPPGSALKTTFPSLEVLLVSNNHLAELDPESIKGMRIVDVMNNDIDHLNPRIGLLGGIGGLERLELRGNRFRVPRFNVIERGTEATLRWLRGRVPVADMGAWREANRADGNGSDDLD